MDLDLDLDLEDIRTLIGSKDIVYFFPPNKHYTPYLQVECELCHNDYTSPGFAWTDDNNVGRDLCIMCIAQIHEKDKNFFNNYTFKNAHRYKTKILDIPNKYSVLNYGHIDQASAEAECIRCKCHPQGICLTWNNACMCIPCVKIMGCAFNALDV